MCLSGFVCDIFRRNRGQLNQMRLLLIVKNMNNWHFKTSSSVNGKQLSKDCYKN